MAKLTRAAPQGYPTGTKISVPASLSVGRQPPSKRQSHEAENIDNAFVTLERNIEKRAGFEIVPQSSSPELGNHLWDFSQTSSYIDLFALRSVRSHDLWYYWYSINEDNRFLVVVDFDATDHSSKLFYNFHLINDAWTDVTGETQWDPSDPSIADSNPLGLNHSPAILAYATASVPPITYAEALAKGTLSLTSRQYITHKTADKTAKESLKAVTLGSSIVILNSNVSAGFSSDYTDDATNGMLFTLDGEPTSTPDIKGRRVTYFSSSRVIEVFNPGEDEKTDTGDDISLGYKIDATATGTTNATGHSNIQVKLETIPDVHSSISKGVCTATKFLLSGTAADEANSYVGLELIATPTPAGSGSRSGIIQSYDHTLKEAIVHHTDPLYSGLLVSISANTTTANVENIFGAVDVDNNFKGNWLKINDEYRLISSYVTGTITVLSAFSGTVNEGLTEGSPWEIVGYTVDYTTVALTLTSTLHLGPHASGTDDFYNGKYLYIQGQYFQIIDYIASTKVASLSSSMVSNPPINTQFTIVDGIGVGTYIKTFVNNTTFRLPFECSPTNDAYKNLFIKVESGSTSYKITNYTGADRTVTVDIAGSSTIFQAAKKILIFTAIGIPYTIKPKYPADDFYNGFKITLETGTENQTVGITEYDSESNIVTVDTALSPAIQGGVTTYKITSGVAKYIPAGDYIHYKQEFAHLGQQVNDISGIRLPPESYDWYANNANLTDVTSIDSNARVMLAALYDEFHPHKEFVNGRGKIYLTTHPYLNLAAGFYRVIDFVEGETHVIKSGLNAGTTVTGTGRPYLQKVRTQDEWSYIDPARMPQKLSFDISSGDYVWTAEPMRWTPRDTGNANTNPGPSIFRSIDGTKLKHPKLTSLAVFKNRLWFAADDVVFSSRVGAYENLFLADPNQIVDTDPIDIRASSNTFAQITSMTPFENYMFINTKADTQFQLLSSNANSGQDLSITPFNVTLAPSTYYAASAVIDPQLLGNQLYFFDKRRMYLFTGKNALGFNSAVEISSTIKDYLPTNYNSACVAAAHNSVLLTDADHKNHIYCYTIRFSGERIIQSSFYRYILPSDVEIQSIQSYGNHLYAVVSQGTVDEDTSFIYLQRLLLQEEETNIPRLDNLYRATLSVNLVPFQPAPNTSYDSVLNETIIKVPKSEFFSSSIVNGFTSDLYIVLGDGWTLPIVNTIMGSLSGETLIVTDTSEQQILTIGTVITGEGVPAEGVTISAFITGTGGVGSYLVTGGFIPSPIPEQTLTATIQEDISGTAFSSLKASGGDDYTTLYLLGKFDVEGGKIFIGKGFLTTLELSQLYQRGLQDGAVVNGVLNLRHCRVTHHNTGNYDIVVSHRGRTPLVSSFAAPRPDFTAFEDTLSLNNVEESGKFVASIFGYAESTNIKIQSSYLTPMNIVNLEFMGKFKNRNTLLG